LGVVEGDERVRADFDHSESAEKNFVPRRGQVDAGPSGEVIDRHRAGLLGVIQVRHYCLRLIAPLRGVQLDIAAGFFRVLACNFWRKTVLEE
jgi:hypothetical protein